MLSNWVWEHLPQLTGKPYTDSKEPDGTISRLFSASVKPEKLKWHMDNEDRLIEPLHETDWMFQFEDELPVPLNKSIFIKKHQWHRLIKGNGSLVVKITKNARA